MTKAYARQDLFQIWGDDEQTRNLTYMKDIGNALQLTAENIINDTLVNAGISRYVRINEAIEIISDYLDREPDEINYPD